MKAPVVCVTAVVLWTVVGWIGCEPGQGGPESQSDVEQNVTIEFVLVGGDDPAVSFEVAGLPDVTLKTLASRGLSQEDWTEMFAIYAGHQDLPPMTGAYTIERGRICFQAQFPLEAGLRYVAAYHPGPAPGHDVVAQYLPSKKPAPPATVITHVYPSADTLPENLLKFYLHFSAPMSRGEAYHNIHLLTESGDEVDLPFLELDEELWDRQQRRFTLLLDPGRIKHGLKPRQEIGPALQEGHAYTLVIDAAWRDAQSYPLAASHRKSFRVVAPDEAPPNVATWHITPPPASGHKPLRVTFPEPLDHALLSRILLVRGPEGGQVAGRVSITSGETQWQFTPQESWQTGAFQLHVDAILEDLAGNSIGRPFEVDISQEATEAPIAQSITIPFVIRDE